MSEGPVRQRKLSVSQIPPKAVASRGGGLEAVSEAPTLGFGVSLSFLLDVVRQLEEEFPKANKRKIEDFYTKSLVEVDFTTITTSQLCSVFVKPKTAKAQEAHPNDLPKGKASYAEMIKFQGNLVPDCKNPEGQCRAVDYPNHFVSHAWMYPFRDLVFALKDFVDNVEHTGVDNADGERLNHQNMFFWVDMFAVDENHSFDRPVEWWKNTFQQAIGEIGTTVLVLQPWHDPKPLTRSWCLWEIFSSEVKDANFHIIMTPTQGLQFTQRLESNFEDILKVLAVIDVKKANAWNEEDAKMIRQNVDDGVGFENLNQMVKDGIRKWICGQGKESIASMEAEIENTPEKQQAQLKHYSLLSLKLRVGDLLLDLDQQDAGPMLLGVLEDCESLWGPWKEQTKNALVIDCIGSLGDMYSRRKDDSAKALATEYFEWALANGNKLRAEDPSVNPRYFRASIAFGTFLQNTNQPKKAVKLFTTVRDQWLSVQEAGKDDSTLLMALLGIARAHRLEGDHKKALELLTEVEGHLHDRKDKLVLDWVSSKATSMKNLAKDESDKEKRAAMNKEAVDLFRRSFTERKEILGSKHLTTIKAQHDLAKALLDVKKPDVALENCNEAAATLASRQEESDGGLSTEINLTRSKVFAAQGNYAEAEKVAELVKKDYHKNTGVSSPKSYNVLGEIGYYKCMQGHVKEGKDLMMLARDGLVNTVRLKPDHQWVKKLTKRIEEDFDASKSARSNASKVPREIIFDCGTNESKAILCTMVDGNPMVVDIGDPLESMMEYLKTKQNLFVGELRKRAEMSDVQMIRIGMTAWYRGASDEDKKMVDKVFTAAHEANKHLCTIAQLSLTHHDEARYEAIAVDYAARANNLPPTDVLIGSGGGSVQISTAIGTAAQKSYGIPIGFKASQKKLMEVGMSALPELEAKMDAELAAFKRDNPGYKCGAQANVIAISSCYYASVAAGIGENPITVGMMLPLFRKKLEQCKASVKDGELPDKDNAMNLANITLQLKMFSELFPTTATIRFRRNWEVHGLPFRTTWTMGWYLDTHKPNKPKRSRVSALLDFFSGR